MPDLRQINHEPLSVGYEVDLTWELFPTRVARSVSQIALLSLRCLWLTVGYSERGRERECYAFVADKHSHSSIERKDTQRLLEPSNIDVYAHTGR